MKTHPLNGVLLGYRKTTSVRSDARKL